MRSAWGKQKAHLGYEQAQPSSGPVPMRSQLATFDMPRTIAASPVHECVFETDGTGLLDLHRRIQFRDHSGDSGRLEIYNPRLEL
jgi:hypothetical protein